MEWYEDLIFDICAILWIYILWRYLMDIFMDDIWMDDMIWVKIGLIIIGNMGLFL
jgi:hypothetical protein